MRAIASSSPGECAAAEALKGACPFERRTALLHLRRANAAVLAAHAPLIASLLSDSEHAVRQAALSAMQKCPRTTIAKHAAVIATLCSMDRVARNLIRRVPDAELGKAAAEVCKLLVSSVRPVRSSGVGALCRIPPAAMVPHLCTLAISLRVGVARGFAWQVLRNLAPRIVADLDSETLQDEVSRQVELMVCPESAWYELLFSLKLLHAFPPALLARRTDTICLTMQSPHASVRAASSRALARLESVPFPHCDVVLHCIATTPVAMSGRIRAVRSRVRLHKLRVLFWAQRLIWFWYSAVHRPGLASSIQASREFELDMKSLFETFSPEAVANAPR